MKAKTEKNQRKPGKRTKAVEAVLPPPEQRGLAAFAPEVGSADVAQPTAQAVMVPLDLIDVPKHLEEIPLDEAEVRSISATVRAGGLIHPISLRPKTDGRYELVAGRHRLAAHKLLGMSDVLALLRTDWDDAAAHVARAVENLRRRRLSPYEEAQGYRDMLDAHLSPEQVADACQVSAKVVRERLKLLALPVDVGVRLGTPEVPLSHADALLQLVPYPEHFAIAKKVLGKLDYDKRPLTAAGFGDAVAAELRAKRLLQDLGSFAARDRMRRHPTFAKAAAKLPAVKLGCATYCVDPKAYRKTVQPFMQKDRAAKEVEDLQRMQDEAKQVKGKPAREDHAARQERREFLEAYTGHEHAGRIVQAAKGLIGMERVHALVAAEVLAGLAHEVDYDRAVALLSEATGASPSDVADALASDEDPKVRAAFVERLCTSDDPLPLARFLVVGTLLRLEARWGAEWETVARDWLGIDPKTFEKDAERAYKAWIKSGRGPLPWDEPEVEGSTKPVPPVAATQEDVAAPA